MRKIILSFLFVLLLPAQDVFNSQAQANIRVLLPQVPHWEQILFHAADCSILVDRTLGFLEPPKRELRISTIPDADIRYFPGEDTLLFSERVIRACVLRRVHELYSSAGYPPNKGAAFLSAALAHRLARRKHPGVYSFKTARNQFASGFYPKAQSLLADPIEPSHPALFRLYAMHAELLLALMTATKDNATDLFRKHLEMEAHGRSPQEAAAFVLSALLPPKQSSQRWYEENIGKMATEGYQNGSPEIIRQKLSDITSIPLLTPEKNRQITSIPLEQLSERFDDSNLDYGFLSRIRFQILKLRMDAPPLLQPPLEEYAAAVNRLQERDFKGFRKQFASARQNFETAYKKQLEISAELCKFESDRLPLLHCFQPYLEILLKTEESHKYILPSPSSP